LLFDSALLRLTFYAHSSFVALESSCAFASAFSLYPRRLKTILSAEKVPHRCKDAVTSRCLWLTGGSRPKSTWSFPSSRIDCGVFPPSQQLLQDAMLVKGLINLTTDGRQSIGAFFRRSLSAQSSLPALHPLRTTQQTRRYPILVKPRETRAWFSCRMRCIHEEPRSSAANMGPAMWLLQHRWVNGYSTQPSPKF
jgi:hypothetical protein